MWHAYGNANGDAHIHADGDCDGNCHIHSDGDSNGNCDRTDASYTDAATSADTAAACEQLLCK